MKIGTNDLDFEDSANLRKLNVYYVPNLRNKTKFSNLTQSVNLNAL